MCAKRERHEVYQPVADLDLQLPVEIRTLTLALDKGGNTIGAWCGAAAYYGLLENV